MGFGRIFGGGKELVPACRLQRCILGLPPLVRFGLKAEQRKLEGTIGDKAVGSAIGDNRGPFPYSNLKVD